MTEPVYAHAMPCYLEPAKILEHGLHLTELRLNLDKRLCGNLDNRRHQKVFRLICPKKSSEASDL
jgi:hypothetical protein